MLLKWGYCHIDSAFKYGFWLLYLIYGTEVIDLRFVIPMLWYTFVGMTQSAIRAFEFACNLDPICKSG